jgi:hypothetical protein
VKDERQSYMLVRLGTGSTIKVQSLPQLNRSPLGSTQCPMKTCALYILLILWVCSCCSSNHSQWRDIDLAEFESVAGPKELHGCIAENSFMLRGFTLGEEEMRVEFASVKWDSGSDSVFIAGEVVNRAAEPLSKVTVAIGGIDTVAEAGRISPIAQTVTDGNGHFSLTSKMMKKNKLAFTLVGYLARLYDIDKLFQ